jgi:hypothetical protein
MTIVIEIPEELNVIGSAVEDLVHAAMAQVERGKLGGAVDYDAFEGVLSDKLSEVERRIHKAALSALDINVPRLRINGRLHSRVIEATTTQFQSLAGEVSVTRALYRPLGERNAPTVDLVALRAGAIEGTWLPRTAREMAFDVQQLTSREAETRGKRRGRLSYSHSSFERIAHVVGEMYVQQHQPIEQILIEDFEVPKKARSVSVSLDRVSVPMEKRLDQGEDDSKLAHLKKHEDEPQKEESGAPEGQQEEPKRKIEVVYRMAYCATVTLHDERGEALFTIRYGTMPEGDAPGLVGGLADDVIAILGQRPDLKVVLLCDGAHEMWNLLDDEFTKSPFTLKEYVVRRLIDFWHAVEKLAPAAKIIAGEKDSKPLLARWKLLLRNSKSGSAQILGELIASGMKEVEVGTNKPVHEAITYFTNHADKMAYATARKQGLPIGSGNVEATCKSIVGGRMKRPGSRWKNRTGEHIIHMRALALSDRWDAAMDIVFKQPNVRVRAVAA